MDLHIYIFLLIFQHSIDAYSATRNEIETPKRSMTSPHWQKIYDDPDLMLKLVNSQKEGEIHNYNYKDKVGFSKGMSKKHDWAVKDKDIPYQYNDGNILIKAADGKTTKLCRYINNGKFDQEKYNEFLEALKNDWTGPNDQNMTECNLVTESGKASGNIPENIRSLPKDVEELNKKNFDTEKQKFNFVFAPKFNTNTKAVNQNSPTDIGLINAQREGQIKRKSKLNGNMAMNSFGTDVVIANPTSSQRGQKRNFASNAVEEKSGLLNKFGRKNAENELKAGIKKKGSRQTRVNKKQRYKGGESRQNSNNIKTSFDGIKNGILDQPTNFPTNKEADGQKFGDSNSTTGLLSIKDRLKMLRKNVEARNSKYLQYEFNPIELDAKLIGAD